MASSPDYSLLDLEDSQLEDEVDLDATVDQAIDGLQRFSTAYKEKAKENNSTLQKLGCNMNSFPEERKVLKNIFSESEMFNFHSAGSKELLTVNPQQLMDSFSTDEKIAELQRLGIQLDIFLSHLQHSHNILQRKLEIKAAQSQILEQQASQKAVKNMLFKEKLEKAQREFKTLQDVSETVEKPRYNMEELKVLHEELNKSKQDVALTRVKLDKYNNLPLSNKGAAEQLAKLKQELANVDNQIKAKVISAGDSR